MKDFIDSPIIPFICFLFFKTQGLILSSGGSIAQLMPIVVMAYSFVCAYRIHIKETNRVIVAIDLFILIWLIYYIVACSNAIAVEPTPLKGVLISIMPFFIFYHYANIGKISTRMIIGMTSIYLAFMIPFYFYNQNTFVEYLESRGIITDEIINNTAYSILFALPIIKLLNKRLVINITIVIIAYFVLISAKRGAILVFAILLLYHFFNSKKISLKYILAYIVPLMVIGIFATYLFLSKHLFTLERIEAAVSGDFSGRTDIYIKLFEYCLVYPKSLMNLLFGYGYNATMRITYIYAHNDWLEILTDFGLFGVAIYGTLIIRLYNAYRNITNITIRDFMKMSFIILFTTSIFSMGYSNCNLSFMYMGFSLGYYQMQRRMGRYILDKK